MPTVTPPTPVVSSSAAQTAASAGVTPIEASIGNAPDKIQQLAHQIQISGLIAQPPDGGTITLNTALGNLTIVLPLLAKDQQDKLIQQLTNLFQSQKPLTVVVQPGEPPTQAFLLLPPPTAAANPPLVTDIQTNMLLQTVAPLPPPLTPGEALPAVVLPINTLPASNPSAQPNAAMMGGPPLLTVPTNDQLAILTDLSLLDELASKTEELMGQVIPEIEAKLFSGMPVSQNLPQAPLPSAAAPTTPTSSLPLNPPPAPSTASSPLSAAPMPLPVLSVPPAVPVTPLIPQASPPLASLLQPGMVVSLRVDAVALPSAPPPVPNAPNQLLVSVTGSGPNGQLLVQSGTTALYVKQSVNVPVGSTLLVTVEAGKAPPLVPLPLPDSNNFGQLQQALMTLAQTDPQLARQVMETIIPQPNAALGGALLFILSAFGQGNLRGWLGNNAVDVLTKAGKIELIAKLTQQLSEGGQVVHDPVVGAWRSYAVPLHADNQFQTLHFYVHGDGRGPGGKNEKETKPGAHAIRFLIDMRLSKIGAMQIDGFVRPQQLDMVIRSEKILPEGLNQNLRQTYIKTLDAVGYVGTLNFQTGREHWLNLRRASGSMVT